MSFFDVVRFEELRQNRGVVWGRPVRVLEICTSTNDLALSAIDGPARTGIVFLAREQTQGRGRRGSSWTAPPGECLMFSVLLRYPKSQSGTFGLSLTVGLALLDALGQLASPNPSPVAFPSPRLSIKWPNDVYAGDKKLAGVLIESRKDPEGQLGVVIGIGLNLSTLSFPPQLNHATSLALIGLPPPPLEELLLGLLEALQNRVAQFLARGCHPIALETAAHDYLEGRALRIEGREGVGAGITEAGELLVEHADGSRRAWSTGHIEVLET